MADEEYPSSGGLPEVFDNWITKLLAAVEELAAGGNPYAEVEAQVEEARKAKQEAVEIQAALDRIDVGPEAQRAKSVVEERAAAAARESLVNAANILIRTVNDEATPGIAHWEPGGTGTASHNKLGNALKEFGEDFRAWRNDRGHGEMFDGPQAPPFAGIREVGPVGIAQGAGEAVQSAASAVEGPLVDASFGGSETLRRGRTPTTDDDRISGILDDLAEQLSVSREQAVTRLAELDPLGGEFGEDGTRLYAALERLGDDLGYSVGELLTADAITAPRLEEGGGEGDVRSYQGIKEYLSVAFDADFPHYQDATGDFTFRHEVDALLDEFIAADVGFAPDVGSFRDHDGGEGQKRAL